MSIDDRTAVGVRRQARLLEVLACPNCHLELQLHGVTEREGAVVDAGLRCSTCGEVGVIRSYRPSFHADDLHDGWAPAGLAEAPIDVRSRAEVVGEWLDLPTGIMGVGVGACLTGLVDGPGVVFELATHSWGAAALVSFAEIERRVELYEADAVTMHRVVLHSPDDLSQPRRWSVVVAPVDSPDPARSQAFVQSIASLVPAADAPPLQHLPANHGNPYPHRFGELLDSLDEHAVVLDLGGGDRCHPDPRVLNFEYSKFRRADFFGDGLHVPIASDSVDLIMSQAVLEHVPDPPRAVAEMRRILRPGGRLYAEFAFMQPLHAAPHHYFNITPHGSALLFADWDVKSTGVFGGLSVTTKWFFQLLNADAKLGPERAAAVLDSLTDLDAQLTDHELAFVASAVYVEATKSD